MVLCRKFRPERLTFHHLSCLNAAGAPAAASAAAAVTCAQEARMAEEASSQLNRHQPIISGGFANFAAAYPQYCESKCPAAAAAVDTVDGGCCQHAGRYLVEPSYTSQGPTQLLSFVYVGSQSDACDADVMRRHGITHVLNVSANCVQSQHVPEAAFMRVPVNDGYSDKLLPHFKLAFQFLDNVRKSNGRCLVHCLAGISRSPTVAIAYIMQHLGLSQDEAYRFVKARRPSISPNFNFLGQLLEFERLLQAQKKQKESSKEDTAEDAAESVAAFSSSSDNSDEAESACSEAKRQRRFCLSVPAASTLLSMSSAQQAGSSPTPIGALSRLSFAAQQQQKQIATETGLATAPPMPNCAERRQLIKRRQRPNSEVLSQANATTTASSATVVASTASLDAAEAATATTASTMSTRSSSQELISCS
ncbi:hypothetical protein BOX15_Mlig006006g1 [Macrostomum lignano]|uniref:protein-tyrosine-phosphatase n=1 Tax=Macrostomum lignano TaxID=282301 RepID=A0A267EXK5_9PLAT|nr:hypothetical protein BOX15_Mlig006006g1 [Macrostomum lignano]